MPLLLVPLALQVSRRQYTTWLNAAMIFALNYQPLKYLLQMRVGLPDLCSRNPRVRFLFMQHICQISDIPQLLQICCECTDELCSCHARDGYLLQSRQVFWSGLPASDTFPLPGMPRIPRHTQSICSCTTSHLPGAAWFLEMPEKYPDSAFSSRT